MPQSWSDWVSFVGAIIGSLTGVASLLISYVAVRRDRAKLVVNVRRADYHFASSLHLDFPNIQFGSPQYGDADSTPHTYYIMTVINRGLRPIHLVRVGSTYWSVDGPGSSHGIAPLDVTLTESYRRIHFAFVQATSARDEFTGCWVEDDAGNDYEAFPEEWPRHRRLWWRVRRAVSLHRERRLRHDVQIKVANGPATTESESSSDNRAPSDRT